MGKQGAYLLLDMDELGSALWLNFINIEREYKDVIALLYTVMTSFFLENAGEMTKSQWN